jgi:hypothetical protein
VRLEKNVVNRSGAFAGAVRHRLIKFFLTSLQFEFIVCSSRALWRMPLSAPFDLGAHEEIALLAACCVARRGGQF